MLCVQVNECHVHVLQISLLTYWHTTHMLRLHPTAEVLTVLYASMQHVYMHAVCTQENKQVQCKHSVQTCMETASRLQGCRANIMWVIGSIQSVCMTENRSVTADMRLFVSFISSDRKNNQFKASYCFHWENPDLKKVLMSFNCSHVNIQNSFHMSERCFSLLKKKT